MSKYSGKQGSFTEQIQAFADQAKEAMDLTFREVMLEIGVQLIKKSPVGNPEAWRSNKVAVEYNAEVARLNYELGQNPANVNKRGRLKPGLKIRDGMDLKGQGYIGGRFRGNWQFTINVPASGALDRIDPNGNDTMEDIRQKVQGLSMGETAYIVNNLEYAVPLEYGHSDQAPNGMVRITVARFQQIVDEAIRKHRV